MNVVNGPPTTLTPYFVQSKSYLSAALPEIEQAAQVPGWQQAVVRITQIFTLVALGKMVFDLTKYLLTQHSFPRVPTHYLNTSLWAGAGLVALYLHSRVERAYITSRKGAAESLEALRYLQTVKNDEPLSTFPNFSLYALDKYLAKHPGRFKNCVADTNLAFARIRLVVRLTLIFESPKTHLNEWFGNVVSEGGAINKFEENFLTPAQLAPELNEKIKSLLHRIYQMPANQNTYVTYNSVTKLDELLKNPSN